VYQARAAIGDEPFVLVFGDNMTGYRLSRLVEDYQERSAPALLAVCEGGDPHRQAVVSVQGDRVCLIEERPGVARSPYTSAGMYAFDSSIFPAIEKVQPQENGEYYLPHAIQILIDSGVKVSYTVADGWRVNINDPADLLRALQHVLEDEARARHQEPVPWNAAEVAFAGEVRLLGDVRFGRYTYIGNGCTIGHNTCISNTIVMDNVTIGANCVICNAILGEGVHVPDGTCTERKGAPIVVPDGHVLSLS
jgi:dTDP-glucose pyrophosphorylase